MTCGKDENKQKKGTGIGPEKSNYPKHLQQACCGLPGLKMEHTFFWLLHGPIGIVVVPQLAERSSFSKKQSSNPVISTRDPTYYIFRIAWLQWTSAHLRLPLEALHKR